LFKTNNIFVEKVECIIYCKERNDIVPSDVASCAQNIATYHDTTLPAHKNPDALIVGEHKTVFIRVQPRDTSPCSIGYLDFRSHVPSQDNEIITFMTLVMMFHTARTFFITERKEENK
jgi:hypothetical protein